MLRAIYCKPGAKCSAHPPVYAMWTVVPDIYKAFTAPHIQARIFNWTYLRCYRRYHDNSMRAMLQTWWQIQRTSPSLRCVNCGLGYLQSIYSTAYSDINIQLNVSALLLQISRECYARYTAILEPNAAHILQFTQCVLWSRTYTKYLQLRIYMLQYSMERICAAIGNITTIQCA
jgi:hypothetical protein